MTARLLHTEHMRLRWGEMDALRHLNNVAYFRYFEEARIAWFASLGARYETDAEGALLGTIGCRFIRPVLYPADVTVQLHAGRVGNASFTISHRLALRDDPDAVFAEGDAVLVWVELASGKSRTLPDTMRRALQG